jgi:uncharacterized membrane protein
MKINATAESFATLAIGLWAIALIDYQTSGISGLTYFLIGVGVFFALFGLYLRLPFSWRQDACLEFLEKRKYIKVGKLLGWFLVLVVFGIGLWQSKVIWLMITGFATVIIAYIVLYLGIFRLKEKQQ